MKRPIVKAVAVTVAVVMLLTGCSTEKGQNKDSFTADNEIISYTPVDTAKRIVTIGKYDSFDETFLEQALESHFPELDIVFMETLAGPNPFAYMALQSQQNKLPDIMFCKLDAPENDFLYDLSGEDFLGRYNLSALNSLSNDGKLFQLPTTNSVQGIVYNKTLFEKHGWKVPETLDEFYTLCDEISAEGIRPFAACTKYMEQLVWLTLGFSYDNIFSDIEKQLQYTEFAQGKISCKDLMEPSFEVLKDLYEKGLLLEEDFTASITQYGYNVLNGETAMIPRNLDILSLPTEKGIDCELGFFGFPTKEPGKHWMQMIPGTKISVAKSAMEDEQHRQDILNILDYISTNDGQKILQKIFHGISNLSSYQQESAFEFQGIQDCMEEGRVLYTALYGSDQNVEVFLKWTKGELSINEMIDACDNFEIYNELALLEKPSIGKALEDFTVLETSIYQTDVMQEKTGAEIALMLNRNYFKGNLAGIYEGNIVYPERFCLKGINPDDALTTYHITGANLKLLMEHPIINGTEVNAMYAPAGLKMVFAPWLPIDANVQSLTLADGTPLDDEKLYTVAAWGGTIDERYISDVVKTYDELGTNQDLMTAAIAESEGIKPADDGRLVLDWQTEK